ncbi:MAG: sulfotransferase [Vitreimonas sp.]
MKDDQFERPVFIVNPPRSGSTFLFETLVQAPNLYTVGGESHGVIEGLPELSMPRRNWSSNRLTADDAAPPVVAQLRARFASVLRDREGQRPATWPVRMLEKTPKNSLRIPFMATVFPTSHFVYLYRDVRQVLASMMEAWQSGRFRTYPGLPGWTGPLPWSLLLTPGWRNLGDLPLHHIVAAQWAASTQILLDDLERLPAEQRAIVRYDQLVENPEQAVRALCEAVGWSWDRGFSAELPLSVFTVSAPKADKWRARANEIEEVLPSIRDLVDRAERFVEGA